MQRRKKLLYPPGPAAHSKERHVTDPHENRMPRVDQCCWKESKGLCSCTCLPGATYLEQKLSVLHCFLLERRTQHLLNPKLPISAFISVRDFDDAATRHWFGFDSVDEYYAAASSAYHLHAVDTPLMCIRSMCAENNLLANFRPSSLEKEVQWGKSRLKLFTELIMDSSTRPSNLLFIHGEECWHMPNNRGLRSTSLSCMKAKLAICKDSFLRSSWGWPESSLPTNRPKFRHGGQDAVELKVWPSRPGIQVPGNISRAIPDW
eukprot:1157726-Pelagomonas_calceolata.AAC.1